MTGALPVVIAVTSSISAANEGQVRVYWALGAIASTSGLSLLSIFKEIRSEKATLRAESGQAKLRMLLANASQPLVTALGRVASANDLSRRKETVHTLVQSAVSTARAECGTGNREQYRSCFYSLCNSHLSRVHYEGREGTDPPRTKFDLNDKNLSRRADAQFARDVARGERAVLIEDLHEEDLDDEISKPKDRFYRTMLVVPVNAGDQHFGFLSIDSPEPRTLKEIDRKNTVLIAGVLATGLAILRQDGYKMVADGSFEKVR
ncbi:hypothetical protein [Actinophytocola glycyrrhizae]|uniref:GAF domain-containing protein n=1 Tax=Actinophytocola glycyrrhizae TaxID=2044873 RepID=A0ABV9SBG2_9PSEU